MNEDYSPDAERLAALEIQLKQSSDLLHDLEKRLIVESNPLDKAKLRGQISEIKALIEPCRAEFDTLSATCRGRLTEIQAAYLTFLIDRNTYMDPRGVMQTTRSAMLKLDEIYVSLKAERQAERTWTKDRFGHGDADFETELFADLEYREETRLRLKAQNQRIESVELPVAIRTNTRIVMLGDPGAGKTTLMRFLALHFARAVQQDVALVCDVENVEYGNTRLPIFVRISRYAECLKEHKTLSLRRFLPQAFEELNVEPAELERLFCNALRDKRAFVLLDGLDEVIDPGDRTQIAQRIDEFVSANSGNQFLVTSRIAGYRSAPLGGEFAEFTLEDMEPEQISRFLKRWCIAYERHLTPDAPESDVHDRASLEVSDIERALKDNMGVRRLATNPLLLTILCLIKRNGSHMPRRRVELYEIATQTLLRDWQLQRGIPGVQCVEESEALRLLGPLALWLHQEKPQGMASKRDVHQRLAGLLAKERGKTADDPDVEKAVEDFLRRVREHTGLFVERAPGYFGFMHLTFEEYFVGRELVRRSKTAARQIYAHRHLPRWEEPILLAIGYESKSRPEDASDLIRTAILAESDEAKAEGFTPSQYEDVLYRDLLLAAHCLGDCAGADPLLIQYVVSKLINLYFDTQGAGKYDPLRERLIVRISYLGDSEGGKEALRLLSPLLKNKTAFVRQLAISTLGRLKQDTPDAINVLLPFLKDRASSVRLSAVFALAQSRQSTPDVVNALLLLLKDSDSGVQWPLASAWRQLGQSTPDVVSALLPLLKDSDSRVRQHAISALVELGQSTPDVVNALLPLLKDSDSSVRRHTIYALGQLGQGTPDVVNALLLLLKDKTAFVRQHAISTLVQLEQGTPDVVNALLPLLKDKAVFVRQAAVYALRHLGQGTPDVVNALLPLLKDRASSVQQTAVYALGQLRQDTPQIVSASLKLLHDNDIAARETAIITIMNLFARRSVSLNEPSIIHIQEELRRSLTDMQNAGISMSSPYNHVYDVIWESLWTVCAPTEKYASLLSSRA